MITTDRPEQLVKRRRRRLALSLDHRLLKRKVQRILGLASDPRQPSRELFRGVRRRLTLWYSAVIAAALILCGAILYLSVQQSLLGPMNRELQANAQYVEQQWQAGAPSFFSQPYVCPHEGRDLNLVIACYGAKGELFGDNLRVPLPSFTSSGLARSVLHGGSASDTVTTGLTGEFANLQRYATWVPVTSGSHKALGVLVVGLPVGGQGNALSTLLRLLLLLGALTILLSFGAGLFLANRALHPARVAYARQRDFIADASHELRTPLTMLRSSVEFVLRGSDHLPPDDVVLLRDTVEETTHLTSLANNMLDLARLDSDEVHVDEEVIDAGEIITEVSRWATPLANEKSVAVITDAPDAALVLGDRAMLEQAVLVLVDNAIKYNRPGGSVRVAMSLSHNLVSITVADTGIGVTPDDLKRLGERFYRVDKARSRESGGAGLGLSIVRSIVSRHRGEMSFDSLLGEGTTVAIRLPMVGTPNGHR